MLSGMANDNSPRAAGMGAMCAKSIRAIWVVPRLINRPYVFMTRGDFLFSKYL
jgi:hypothetical protein